MTSAAVALPTYGPWAERCSAFGRTFLRHTTGQWAGQPVVFEPWQMEILTDVLDSVDPLTGYRQIREAYVEIPKKNGKSTMCSALAAYALVDEGRREPGMEVYACATSKDQGRIVFGETKDFLEASPVRRFLNIKRDYIEVRKTGAVFRVLAADGFSIAGLKPAWVFGDEIYAWTTPKTLEMYAQLRLAGANRRQFLFWGITTAGFDLNTIAGRNHRLAQANAERAKKKKPPVDPRFYGKIYGLTAKESKSPKAYKKANPASWITPRWLEEEFNSARAGHRLADFQRLQGCVWTRAEEMMLPAGAWDKCKGKVEIETGDDAYVGVDIGLRSDSTGLVTAVKKGDKIHLRATSWAVHPDPREEPPLTHNTVEADSVNLGDVEHEIRDQATLYNVEEVDFDDWGFTGSAQTLEDEGLPMVKFSQGSDRMGPATEHFIRLVMEKRIVHDGDEVLAAHVGAATVRHTRFGRRMDKTKARNHMDLAVAAAMAAFRADQDDGGGEFKVRNPADYL